MLNRQITTAIREILEEEQKFVYNVMKKIIISQTAETVIKLTQILSWAQIMGDKQQNRVHSEIKHC